MDNSRFTQIMSEYGTIVLRTAYLYSRDRHVSEEICQEVFIKVYKHLGSFKNQSTLKTWIIRITINQCKDYLKSSWVRRVYNQCWNWEKKSPSPSGLNSPEEEIVALEERSKLFMEVLKLPVKYRVMIVLHYYHGFSIKEISSIINIPEGTARSRLFKSRQKLKTNLEKGGF